MIQQNVSILAQLQTFLTQISPQDYSRPLPLLQAQPIGRQVRHCLEFYICFLESISKPNALLSYDKRKRDLRLETILEEAQAQVLFLQKQLQKQQIPLVELILESDAPQGKMRLVSSTERELLYLLEHTVHHLAILRLSAQCYFPYIEFAGDFGVAYATQKNEAESNASKSNC
ncbi:hypothetical protein [Hugenholtzia roseola]|uniref:hypothetical protein n=1 Tax=Hugenholtzia roseola TaxID=1002 RepID=UPI000406EA1C|nr:hypothetical protein [Hugenholtzia roseola]